MPISKPTSISPQVAKRTAMTISAALLFGIAVFGAVVLVQVPFDSPPPVEAESSNLDLIFLVFAVAAALGSTAFGRRMYDESGDADARIARMLRFHVLSAALPEGAALLGLVAVQLSGSWDAALPLWIGLAALLATLVRAPVAFGRIR